MLCSIIHEDESFCSARDFNIINSPDRLVDKECYSWTGKNDQCRLRKRSNLKAAGCRNPPNPLRTELYKVGPAYRLGNETDIMQEILTSGPVQGSRYDSDGRVNRNSKIRIDI